MWPVVTGASSWRCVLRASVEVRVILQSGKSDHALREGRSSAGIAQHLTGRGESSKPCNGNRNDISAASHQDVETFALDRMPPIEQELVASLGHLCERRIVAIRNLKHVLEAGSATTVGNGTACLCFRAT